jgi:hypothetical protein
MSYAPKAGKQSERTERRHAKKSNDLREFERSKGIPSKQSTLSFKPKVTMPIVQAPNHSTTQTQPIYEIDHSDDEILCISPKSPSPILISLSEDSENEEDEEFEIVSAWLIEREGEGASEELLAVVDENMDEDDHEMEEEDADEEDTAGDTDSESANRMIQEGTFILILILHSRLPILHIFHRTRRQCRIRSGSLSAYAPQPRRRRSY